MSTGILRCVKSTRIYWGESLKVFEPGQRKAKKESKEFAEARSSDKCTKRLEEKFYNGVTTYHLAKRFYSATIT